MSRQQLPQRQVPLLPGNGGRKKGGVKITTILGFTFMAGLICSIVGVGAIIVFPEIGTMIRVAMGFPVTPISPDISQTDTTGLELTAQVIGLTQTALAQNPSYPSNTPFLPPSLPTYTPPPPLPTYTFPPSLPTYTLLPPLPTYTPYPSPASSLPPLVQSPTVTPEPNLIFSDTFDNDIAPGYWQQFGTWMISNGYPVLMKPYKNTGDYNAFSGEGGLIFPGTSQMDNIAIEFDSGYPVSLYFLLSYQDEYNYKEFRIDLGGHSNNQLRGFIFVSKGNAIGIPQSEVYISTKSPINHVRVEIRGNSLAVYVNSELKYNFKDLPEKVTGTVGFVTDYYPDKTFLIDNFKIYQLP